MSGNDPTVGNGYTAPDNRTVGLDVDPLTPELDYPDWLEGIGASPSLVAFARRHTPTAEHRRERRRVRALSLAVVVLTVLSLFLAVTKVEAALRTTAQNQTPAGIQRPGMAGTESPRSEPPSGAPSAGVAEEADQTPPGGGAPLTYPVPATPSGGVGEPAQAVRGPASWFATGPSGMFAAAGPRLRVGAWRGRVVTVTSGGVSVRVVLNDFCQCYGSRLIDLSDAAFARLGPLSRGVLDVTVEWP